MSNNRLVYLVGALGVTRCQSTSLVRQGGVL